jgi:hypothetical protein
MDALGMDVSSPEQFTTARDLERIRTLGEALALESGLERGNLEMARACKKESVTRIAERNSCTVGHVRQVFARVRKGLRLAERLVMLAGVRRLHLVVYFQNAADGLRVRRTVIAKLHNVGLPEVIAIVAHVGKLLEESGHDR